MDIRAKRCLLFDLDGTVYLGDKPIAGTIRYIQENPFKQDIYFLTNNTSKNLDEYLTKLARFGIHTDLEHMISPLLPLVEHLEAQGLNHIYPVGNAGFCAFLRQRMPGILLDDSPGCQAVVVAYDTELTYDKLMRSCLLLQKPEVVFLATHPDAVCPSALGPLPDTGSFLALYQAATGRKPQVVFGKPNPLILGTLAQRYAVKDMVMIGDRLYTDMVLAHNAGMDCILVLSGESREADLAGLERQPTLVVPDLGVFLE